jgi:molybdate transport system ATP-binding protein
MLVLEAGRVVQRGAPAEVARRPRTDYVAAVMGINLLAGHADGTRVRLDGGGQLVVSQPVHGDVHVAVRPAAIALYGDEPLAGSPRNRWRGSVVGVEQRGNEVRVSIAGPPDVMVDVTAAALGELRLTPGMTVWCAAKATEIDAYPR